MPWIKRRSRWKIWKNREIKIYTVAIIFSVLTALAVNFAVDWGRDIFKAVDMITALEMDAESAEKIKSFLEKNVDAATLEKAKGADERNDRIDYQKIKSFLEENVDAETFDRARKVYERNDKIDYQKMSAFSGGKFDAVKLEELKNGYHDLQAKRR